MAAGVVLSRLARGRRRRPPLAPVAARETTISVVVPARDEQARIGPCLAGLGADDGVAEVIVVDDGSSDGTAAVARAAGARVIAGQPLPPGWVGKQWALQQGVLAASGDVVVTLDADTRPRPGLAGAMAAALRDADFVSAGPRFVCDSAGERFLHPSFLCTLSYRFGPVAAEPATTMRRAQANGQCTAFDRDRFLAGGGYERVRSRMTEDVALARALVREGWRVGFEDGADLLGVKMHDSPGELWREWGRSLAMADVTPPAWRAADVATVWLTMAAPPLRIALGRASWLDWLLLGVRIALLPAFARFYARRGAAFWLSPLADPATAVRLTLSSVRQTRRWRGRVYDGA